MQISNLEEQIITILQKKYDRSIDKDDPLMLSISAQVMVTEYLLDIQKNNLQTEYDIFKNDLTNLLNNSKINSSKAKQELLNHLATGMSNILNRYIKKLNQEFLKADSYYQDVKKIYTKIKIFSIIITILCIISVLFIKF